MSPNLAWYVKVHFIYQSGNVLDLNLLTKYHFPKFSIFFTISSVSNNKKLNVTRANNYCTVKTGLRDNPL